MNSKLIRQKFGDNYIANEKTFKMGIDRRITKHIAQRFRKQTVLETCTGAGFTTISLAREVFKVISVEINPDHQDQAKKNVEKSGFIKNVEFILGDILDDNTLKELPHFESAFLDPDWADTGPNHMYHFINSNTKPPADELLNKILSITKNAAIILPPLLDAAELENLPQHERQKIFMDDCHVLYCLFFGDLINSVGKTELRV